MNKSIFTFSFNLFVTKYTTLSSPILAHAQWNEIKNMMRYKKFLIKPVDHFDELNFPKLEEDMAAIKLRIGSLPENFKAEIIISFLNGQAVKEDWKEANPTLTRLVTKRKLDIGCLEDLFTSSTHNGKFQQGLESYIRKMLD